MAAAHAAGAGDRVTDTQLTWAAAFADAGLEPWFEQVLAAVPGGELFDAHTHIGCNDPDGFKLAPEQLLAGLERAHARSVVFPMHEPDGYPPANDAALELAAASDGRVVAFARLDPADAPLAEAERAVAAGARGLKLHPRAEQFALADPRLEGTFAFADEHRLPVLVHAGRGIPALGRHAVELCERHPGLRIILAHAGISDLSWIWAAADELPNLFFDSVVVERRRPAGAVHAGAAGPDRLGQRRALRNAADRGVHRAALRPAGGAVGRPPARRLRRDHRGAVAGEEPPDLGPPIGTDRIDNDVLLARVETFLITALGRMLVGADGHEALQLARLACDVERGTKPAATCASVVVAAGPLRRGAGGAPRRRHPRRPGLRGRRGDRRAHARRAPADDLSRHNPSGALVTKGAWAMSSFPPDTPTRTSAWPSASRSR